MAIKADLHIHTNYSDGFCSPLRILEMAQRRLLNIISITDHDTTAGSVEAISLSREFNVTVIPGVELSTRLDDTEIHILAYYLDYSNPALITHLESLREERVTRAKKIIQKLNEAGVTLDFEEVLEFSGVASLGRPHIAMALIKKGIVKDYLEAFVKYLSDYAPTNQKRELISPKEAINVIKAAEGIPIIAHPGNLPEDTLKELVKHGAMGFEAVHPSNSSSKEKLIRGFTKHRYLLATGGSDFHGGKRNDDANFGNYFIRNEAILEMRRKHFKYYGKAV